jgi:L-threonylcarbamoyladenylate synthase
MSRADQSPLSLAVDALQRGGTVILPTETVYGLAADALKEAAVARIFEIKQRPHFNPLIVHGALIEMLEPLVTHFSEEAKLLARRYWPGPLTLVLPKHPSVPDLVTAGQPSVAVRIPRHPLALAVIRAFGGPVAAPSANSFGRLSPTRFADLTPEILGAVDAALDGGPCEVGVESTIVSFLQPTPHLLRSGAIPLEELRALLESIEDHTGPTHAPVAPGQLLSHYAPQTPLVLSTPGTRVPKGLRVGLIALTAQYADLSEYASIERLSVAGNLTEAAQHLFSSLKRLENASLDLIVAHLVPETGLGKAINDRFYRAASGRWL